MNGAFQPVPLGYKDGTAQRNGIDGHRKSQMYQEPLLFNNDPISELSPLTYNDVGVLPLCAFI